MTGLSPDEREEDRRSMAERAVGGLAVLNERRPVEPEDLRRVLAGFLVARFFKAQRTGGFEPKGRGEAVLARAAAWQAYLEDAEGGQELPPVLKEVSVLAELASSVSAFLDALAASPVVEREAAVHLREAFESDHPPGLPGLLEGLAQAIRGLP